MILDVSILSKSAAPSKKELLTHTTISLFKVTLYIFDLTKRPILGVFHFVF